MSKVVTLQATIESMVESVANHAESLFRDAMETEKRYGEHHQWTVSATARYATARELLEKVCDIAGADFEKVQNSSSDKMYSQLHPAS